MTGAAVLARIDAATVFVDIDPKTLAQAIRKFGLEQLNAGLAQIRKAEGDDRMPSLSGVAEQLGQLVGAGAIVQDFAKESLIGAASAVGLIGDHGAKAVKAVIAESIKLGRKSPRDLSEVRSRATAGAAATRSGAQSGDDNNGRPREAGDSDTFHLASTEMEPSPAPPGLRGGAQPSQKGDFPEVAAAAGRGGKGVSSNEDDGDRNRRLAFFPLTDLGNAERFCDRYRNQLKWYPAKETWLAWDGKRWSTDLAPEFVKRAEHITVRAIQDEADAVRKSGRRDTADAEFGALDYVVEVKKDGTEFLYSDKIARWGRSSEGINRLLALSKLGAAYLSVSTEDLDADKMKINVSNGTLVVSRKAEGDGDYITFLPHDPADLITKISPVDFDPDAKCSEYDKFLARVQPSEAMRLFLHQWLGLSLTGDISEQKLAYLYGFGANGKSVLMDTVSYVAGDYGETVPIETFLDSGRARSAGQASPDLAILPGVRMLRTSEPETNSKLAEAMVKLVTGGEPILARHLNKGFFKFSPQFKLTISGNHRPKILGTDEGIWRRFQLVPFNVSIPKAERDRKLSEKLIAEAPGILNRLLDGLRHWCDKGLIEPDEVTAATAEYRTLSDPLSRFLATCVEASVGDRIQSSALYAVFEAWCKSAGESVWKQKGFSLAMDERGFKRKHSDVTWFLDLKLVRSVNDFVDSEGRPVTTTTVPGESEQHETKHVGDVEI